MPLAQDALMDSINERVKQVKQVNKSTSQTTMVVGPGKKSRRGRRRRDGGGKLKEVEVEVEAEERQLRLYRPSNPRLPAVPAVPCDKTHHWHKDGTPRVDNSLHFSSAFDHPRVTSVVLQTQLLRTRSRSDLYKRRSAQHKPSHLLHLNPVTITPIHPFPSADGRTGR